MSVSKTPAIAVLLLFFFVLPDFVQAKYSGGSGTVGNPYQIHSATDLLTLAADVNDYNKCFVLTADINLAPYKFTTAVIAYDLDNINEDFDGNAFSGTFDGAGHKITKLTINTNGIENDYLGLFGYVYLEGKIKNLGLENVTVTGRDNSWYIGGLVGENDGNISNCYSTGAVADGNDNWFIGGLAGENDGDIINCFSTGTVAGGVYAYDIGGLVGHNEGGISNCYSTTAVSGGNESICLGGLVGQNYEGSIGNSYSTGDVTGGDANSSGLGGLVGYNEGSISNCYATGDVSGHYFLGGLVGGNHGNSISDCYSTGAVIAEDAISFELGAGPLGGLVGENYGGGTINRCYSTGAVTGGNYSWYLGGLAGWNRNNSIISNCYSIGAVTGEDYSWCLGGLVGVNDDSNISNCYSTGFVAGGYGSDFLGGLAGWSYLGNISNCYFLDTSGPYNWIGIPLTDAHMKLQSSFIGWDFVNESTNGTDDVWTIKEGVDYPKLVWPMVNMVGWYKVDFLDLAYLANWWGREDCTTNNDCDGADFDFSGSVDFTDLIIMCNYWLEGT